MHITKEQILAFDDAYRAQFVNSLSGFKSANLIGTTDNNGNSNLAIVSSVTHLGSNPPLLGFLVRPTNIARHTLENIIDTQQFTVNQVSADIWQQAHQTSLRYPRHECEFEKVGLVKEYITDVQAPFVAESNLKIALQLKEIIKIESNQAQLIIGEVQKVCLPKPHVLKEDGYIDLESLHTVALSGGNSYHLTQRLSRVLTLNDADIADDEEHNVPDWF